MMRLFNAMILRGSHSAPTPGQVRLPRRGSVIASAIFGRTRRMLRQAMSGDHAGDSGEENSPPPTAATDQPFGGLLNAEHEPRILILDDELSVRRVCTFALRGMGWRPEGEASALNALQRIKTGEKFDLVVLDYAMPEMNGLEFLEALSALPDTAKRPHILMASAHADGAVAKQAMTMGVWDFLAKPLMPDDLRRRTRRLLNRNVVAERGDTLSAALRHATRCDWSAAIQALGADSTPPALLLRGLLHEISGDQETARLEYARAYWRADWSVEEADVWSELSSRLDIEE